MNFILNILKMTWPIGASFILMHFVSSFFEARGVQSWVMGVITFIVVLVVMLIIYFRYRNGRN